MAGLKFFKFLVLKLPRNRFRNYDILDYNIDPMVSLFNYFFPATSFKIENGVFADMGDLKFQQDLNMIGYVYGIY
jgi:hypothetical protein